ncbi:MAG: hypothetical protein H7263_10060, partial [Candidatus Sericytochromatia bacterium]|nr:hypothetical protein [Candidatus Sericytochromatia bacterium]
ARTGIDENNTKERKDNRSGWDKADSLAKITKMFNEKARETILRNGTPAEKEQFIKSEKELALYGESGRVSI